MRWDFVVKRGEFTFTVLKDFKKDNFNKIKGKKKMPKTEV